MTATKTPTWPTRSRELCKTLGNLDLPCQLKRHEILHFGQRTNLDNIFSAKVGKDIESAGLAGSTVRDAIRAIVTSGRQNLNNGQWTGDSALDDGSRLPKWIPRWLRSQLYIPRCMNTRSVYLFLAFDCVLYVCFVKLLRFIIQKKLPLTAEQKLLFAGYTELTSAIVCGLFLTLVFTGLNKIWEWIDEPHLLFTLLITAYLFGSNVEGQFPDL